MHRLLDEDEFGSTAYHYSDCVGIRLVCIKQQKLSKVSN